MRKKSKLVYGVGINDADYVIEMKETVGYKENGKTIQKVLWRCPFYSRWANMLKRCYSDKYLKTRPNYQYCFVSEEWVKFSKFKTWMENKDWQNKHLDKDLLFPGNKVYGPDTCIFIDAKVNTFLNESTASRGELPIGVTFDRKRGKYQVRCWSVESGKQKHLGYFNDAQVAHKAWLAFKLEQAYILASQQTDPCVAKALIERYENYGKFN